MQVRVLPGSPIILCKSGCRCSAVLGPRTSRPLLLSPRKPAGETPAVPAPAPCARHISKLDLLIRARQCIPARRLRTVAQRLVVFAQRGPHIIRHPGSQPFAFDHTDRRCENVHFAVRKRLPFAASNLPPVLTALPSLNESSPHGDHDLRAFPVIHPTAALPLSPDHSPAPSLLPSPLWALVGRGRGGGRAVAPGQGAVHSDRWQQDRRFSSPVGRPNRTRSVRGARKLGHGLKQLRARIRLRQEVAGLHE